MKKILSPLIGWVWIIGCSLVPLSGVHWVEQNGHYVAFPPGDARQARSLEDWRSPIAVFGLPSGEPSYRLLPRPVQEWLQRLGVVAQDGSRLSVVAVLHAPGRYPWSVTERLWYRHDIRPGIAAVKLIPLSEGQIDWLEPWDFKPTPNALSVRSLPNDFVKRKFPCPHPERGNDFRIKFSGAEEHEPMAYASLVMDAAGKAHVAIEIIPPAGAVLNDIEAIEGLLKRFTRDHHPCWRERSVTVVEMPPVPPRSPGDGPQEQPFPEPRPSESTWVEPTQYETNDPAERRRLREVWHRQWEVWFAGQVRDWEQRKLRWEELERRRCAALRRYLENDRLRLDAGSRDVQALHQIRQRFAKTLALGLTAEEWHTLQCGEIPNNPDAREVIRQTAEEAEGETLEILADVWDRIVDAPPQQEAQAQDWLQQQVAVGIFADCFGDVAWEAGLHPSDFSPPDRDQSQRFLLSELNLAQAEAMGVRVAAYGIPILTFLPQAGALTQVIRAGMIVVEVVTTAVTTINAVKFAQDRAQACATTSQVASVPPGDHDSDSDDEDGEEVESSEIPEGDLYHGFPEGLPKGGSYNELKEMQKRFGGRTPSGFQKHHLISQEACDRAGMLGLKNRGPSVYVRIEHHKLTASYRVGKSGEALKINEKFIAKQAELLKQGKIREALAMGIKDLQSVEPGYNGGVRLAVKAAKDAGFLSRGAVASGGTGGGTALGVATGAGGAVLGSTVVEGSASGAHSDSRGGDHADFGHDRDHEPRHHEQNRDRERDRPTPEHHEPSREYHERSERSFEVNIRDDGHRDGPRGGGDRLGIGREVREVHVTDHSYHEIVVRDTPTAHGFERSGHELKMSDRDPRESSSRSGGTSHGGDRSGGSGNQGGGHGGEREHDHSHHDHGHHDHHSGGSGHSNPCEHNMRDRDHSSGGGGGGGRSGGGGGDCNVM